LLNWIGKFVAGRRALIEQMRCRKRQRMPGAPEVRTGHEENQENALKSKMTLNSPNMR
jgi:hypothetical protein